MPDYNDLVELPEGVGMSPDERADIRTGVFEAVREVTCDWEDRVTVYNSLIGKEYPYIPNTGAYCRGARMRGWGESSAAGSYGMVAYEKAKITLQYDNRIRFINGYWVEEELNPSAQFRPLDARSFRWESKTSKMFLRPGEGPSMRQVYLDYKLTFHKLPAIPTAVLTHIGTCNNAPFASFYLGVVFDTETLILVAPPAKRSFSVGFTTGWQLSYHFRFLPSGANTFWRPEKGEWESIYHENGTDRYIQYPLMNFNLLFP